MLVSLSADSGFFASRAAFATRRASSCSSCIFPIEILPLIDGNCTGSRLASLACCVLLVVLRVLLLLVGEAEAFFGVVGITNSVSAAAGLFACALREVEGHRLSSLLSLVVLAARRGFARDDDIFTGAVRRCRGAMSTIIACRLLRLSGRERVSRGFSLTGGTTATRTSEGEVSPSGGRTSSGILTIAVGTLKTDNVTGAVDTGTAAVALFALSLGAASVFCGSGGDSVFDLDRLAARLAILGVLLGAVGDLRFRRPGRVFVLGGLTGVDSAIKYGTP